MKSFQILILHHWGYPYILFILLETDSRPADQENNVFYIPNLNVQ